MVILIGSGGLSVIPQNSGGLRYLTVHDYCSTVGTRLIVQVLTCSLNSFLHNVVGVFTFCATGTGVILNS